MSQKGNQDLAFLLKVSFRTLQRYKVNNQLPYFCLLYTSLQHIPFLLVGDEFSDITACSKVGIQCLDVYKRQIDR